MGEAPVGASPVHRNLLGALERTLLSVPPPAPLDATLLPQRQTLAIGPPPSPVRIGDTGLGDELFSIEELATQIYMEMDLRARCGAAKAALDAAQHPARAALDVVEQSGPGNLIERTQARIRLYARLDKGDGIRWPIVPTPTQSLLSVLGDELLDPHGRLGVPTLGGRSDEELATLASRGRILLQTRSAMRPCSKCGADAYARAPLCSRKQGICTVCHLGDWVLGGARDAQGFIADADAVACTKAILGRLGTWWCWCSLAPDGPFSLVPPQ